MKFLILTTLLCGLAQAQSGLGSGTTFTPSGAGGDFAPNTGTSSPGTFTSPSTPGSSINNTNPGTAGTFGTTNSGTGSTPGIPGTTNSDAVDMNTAPTPTPAEANESESFGTSTLSNGTYQTGPFGNGERVPNSNRRPSERQAEEEPLDFSTAPDTRDQSRRP